jgi:DNA-binding MarR family transcriptional regulator
MDHVDRILAQWAAERPDLQLLPMALIGRNKRLAQALGHGMETVFKAHGLNSASFDVLATLRRSGAPYALTPSELIKWTMVTSGTMTNRLDRLEAQGLIERVKSATDARSVTVQLTDAGFQLIEGCVSEHVANQHRLTAGLNADEQAELSRLLGKLLAGVEKAQILD